VLGILADGTAEVCHGCSIECKPVQAPLREGVLRIKCDITVFIGIGSPGINLPNGFSEGGIRRSSGPYESYLAPSTTSMYLPTTPYWAPPTQSYWPNSTPMATNIPYTSYTPASYTPASYTPTSYTPTSYTPTSYAPSPFSTTQYSPSSAITRSPIYRPQPTTDYSTRTLYETRSPKVVPTQTVSPLSPRIIPARASYSFSPRVEPSSRWPTF